MSRMNAYQKIKSRIIELSEKGENNQVIARQMGLKTSEINAILEEHRSQRPKPEYGFEALKELAKQAGLLP